MKKIWVVLVLLLWILAGVQVIGSFQSGERDKILEVLGHVGAMEQQSVLEYQGALLHQKVDKKAFLEEAAEALGLSGEFQVDDEKKNISCVFKESEVVGKLTLSENQEGGYFFARLTFQEPKEAFGAREKLDAFSRGNLEKMGSSMNVIGSFDGKLTLEKRNRAADDLLEKLGAKVAAEHRTMELYTIYAYTPAIEEVQYQNGEAVNVNLAMNYDEEKDRTYLYTAVPVIGLEY